MKTISGLGKLYDESHKYLCDARYLIRFRLTMNGRADITGNLTGIVPSVGQHLEGSYCVLHLNDSNAIEVAVLNWEPINGKVRIRVNNIPAEVAQKIDLSIN